MDKATLEGKSSQATVERAGRGWHVAGAWVRCASAGLLVAANVAGCGEGCREPPPPAPPGDVVLSLATPGASVGPTGSNCKAPPGGAGLTTVTLTLVHTGDGCAPITFLRQRGTEQLGTYTVNCSSPQVASCIDNDEELIWPHPEPGRYTVHVRGRINALECWHNDDILEIPTSGVTRRLDLVRQSSPGC